MPVESERTGTKKPGRAVFLSGLMYSGNSLSTIPDFELWISDRTVDVSVKIFLFRNLKSAFCILKSHLSKFTQQAFDPLTLDSFNNRCNSLTHTNTHCCKSVSQIPFFHFIQQGRNNPCAAHAKRVA